MPRFFICLFTKLGELLLFVDNSNRFLVYDFSQAPRAIYGTEKLSQSDIFLIPNEPNALILVSVLQSKKNKFYVTKYSSTRRKAVMLYEQSFLCNEGTYHSMKQSPHEPYIIAFGIRTVLCIVRMDKKIPAKAKFTAMEVVEWCEFSKTEKDVIMFGTSTHAYVPILPSKTLSLIHSNIILCEK